MHIACVGMSLFCLGLCLRVKMLGHMETHFNFLRTCQTVFQNGFNFTFLVAVGKGSDFSMENFYKKYELFMMLTMHS